MKKIALILSLALSLTYSCTNNLNNTNTNSQYSESSRIIKGIVQFQDISKISKITIKSDVATVGSQATVSLIYPHDHSTNPNKTIATGLTDSQGSFVINSSFSPVNDEILILEASRRIGGSGKGILTLRTFIKWNGSQWVSMTNPGIYINSKTTALAIISSYQSASITPSQTIGTIDTSGDTSVPSTIGSINATSINDLAAKVNIILNREKDPISNIKFSSGVYSIDTDTDISSIIRNKGCSGCNLSGMDFSNIDVSGMDLSYANLQNVDLSNKDLSETILIGADLRGATLPTDLSYLDLSETNLTDHDLRNKNLDGANLSEAVLKNVNLSGVSGTPKNWSKTRFRGADFAEADLRYTIFNKVNFFEAKFQDTKIANADFTDSSLMNVDLSVVYTKDVTGVLFVGADLSGANLSELNLLGKNLTTARLNGADFTKATLSSSGQVMNLSNKDLSNAIFSGADLRNANVANANFRNADFSSIDLGGGNYNRTKLNSVVFSNMNLSNIDFTRADMTSANLLGVNFTGSNLNGVLFTSATVQRVNFSSTDLRNATLRTTMTYCDFSHANLAGQDLTNPIINFSSCKFYNTNFGADGNTTDNKPTKFSTGNLSGGGASFAGSSFVEQDLSEKLSNGSYIARDFRYVNFSNTNLTDSQMGYSNFYTANFNGATMTASGNRGSADFRNATWTTGQACHSLSSPGFCTIGSVNY